MTRHAVIIAVLLAVVVGLSILCSVGLLLTRDAYQKLHFATPVVSVGMLLVCVAVFLHNPDAQARIKVVLIGLVMFFMNAVLSHATARAMAIRRAGGWVDPTRAEPAPPATSRETETPGSKS